MCMAKEYYQVKEKVLMKVQHSVVFLLSLSICSSMGNDLALFLFLALNLTLQFYFKGERRGKKSSNTSHTGLSMGEVFSQEYLFLNLHLCCMILIHRYLKRMIIKISPCGWLLLALPGNKGHSASSCSQSSPRHTRNGELLNLLSSLIANKLRNYVWSWKQIGMKINDIIVTD